MSWFEQAFSQTYLDVYAHRNDKQAQYEVAFVDRHFGFKPHHTVLDLCCGAGRHTFALAPLVNIVVGYDLSSELLCVSSKENLQKKHPNIFWQKGDMRCLQYKSSFDFILSFFNSFGYFESEIENEEVIHNIFNALVPKGKVFMEIMNKDYVLNQLVESSEKTINKFLISEKRNITKDGLRVEKEVEIYQEGLLQKKYKESVRMYTLEELKNIFTKIGFEKMECFGDFDSSHLTELSPRLLFIAQKP